jgi:hypothetical protein
MLPTPNWTQPSGPIRSISGHEFSAPTAPTANKRYTEVNEPGGSKRQ